MNEYWAALQLTFQNVFMRALGVVWVVLIVQLVLRTVIGYLVAQSVRRHRYATRSDEKKREQTLISIFRTASGVLIWVVAFIVILGLFKIQVSTLVTGAGVIGVIVGFGAQSLIRDFLAGFFIIVENQYRVGDTVTLRNFGTELTGVVVDLTVRITRLRDEDGNLHTVPNGISWANTNRTFGYTNVNLDITVDYDTNVEQLEKVIDKAGVEMQQDEVWQKHIIEPIRFVRIENFAEKTLTAKVLGKVSPSQQREVSGEFRKRLIMAFKKAGIHLTHDDNTKKKKD